MTSKEKKERRLRVARMNRVLLSLFPKSVIHLTHSSPWELLVAVILSAQCTDKRVNEVTKDLFMKYRTIEEYRAASEKDMERAVYRCGFYRVKAQNIRKAAAKVLTEFGGEVPRTLEELITLPGVGRKTANVVLASAFGIQSGIAVDTHVRRFAIRFNLTDYRDPKRIEQDLMELMPQSAWWGFNHRLVEYGRAYCPARKHDCRLHPLTVLYPPAHSVWPRAH